MYSLMRMKNYTCHGRIQNMMQKSLHTDIEQEEMNGFNENYI